jgi:hypothetical protein
MQAEKMIPQPRRTSAATTSAELSDILRVHAASYMQTRPVSNQQRKVIRDILACRTPALGGHLETCENGCGYRRLAFHSCRNRHCPKCQALQKLRWVSRRCQRLLPTRYFHVVLTLPHQLNPLVFRNQRILFNLFFEAASQALLQLAQGWPRLQVLPGFTAILHSWNQELAAHVHLHIVITAGGLNPDGSRWIPAKNNFLVPIRALAKLLRGKFVYGLQQLYKEEKLRFPQSIKHLEKPPAFRRLLRNLRRIKWYGYAKPPFRGPQHVFGYLGHYTHRTAISNRRILSLEADTVTFRARNNGQPGSYRVVRLPAHQFIRRFLLHVLPHGFVRIRHFGLFASRNAPSKWKKASTLLRPASDHANLDPLSTLPNTSTEVHRLGYKKLLLILTGFDVTVCPNCGSNLLRLPLPETLPQIDSLCLANPLLDSS